MTLFFLKAEACAIFGLSYCYTGNIWILGGKGLCTLLD